MSLMAFFKHARNNFLLRRKRAAWDGRWRTPDYQPGWLADTPRVFVIAGVESGQFAPGMTLLEIGCGRGTAAAWLAQRGLRVTGIDVSEHVIEQARAAYANQAGLEFRTADVCRPTGIVTAFDIVIDTGCLQHIPESLRDGYYQSLLSWTRPGSRFVVTMHKTDCTASQRLAEVQALFSRSFELVETGEEPPPNPGKSNHLNSVFHFVRRDK